MSEALKCRSCESGELKVVLDLGMQPLANNLPAPKDAGPDEPRFPLRLTVCQDCHLAQIADLVPPVDLFSEYVYFSSFSDTMLRHAAAAVRQHTEEFKLDGDSHVVEIASNDGYLLKNFRDAGIPCLGIEPAKNIAEVARREGIETISEFFGRGLAEELVAAGRAADLILGNNVFAHAPNTNDFVAGLACLLKPDGRIALEFPYAVDFVKGCEFDTIYHEHVFYFSLTALMPLFERNGLEIFRVERLPIHGGSLRLFAARPGTHERDDSVDQLLAEEAAHGFDSAAPYEAMAARADQIRARLRDLVARLRAEGKRVAAYGSSAKGSTLLNYCGINGDDLEFVADRSPHKHGRMMPGVGVLVVAAEELVQRQPDATVLLAWNFANEILEQQAAYREAGGRFVIPIPEVHEV